MTAGEVVGGVLLAGDQLLRVEQLPVGAGADLIDHSGLQVKEDAARDVLASPGLGEEGVESVVTTTNGLVGGHLHGARRRWSQVPNLGQTFWAWREDSAHLAIRLDAVLQAVELPAGIADLDAGLANVN